MKLSDLIVVVFCNHLQTMPFHVRVSNKSLKPPSVNLQLILKTGRMRYLFNSNSASHSSFLSHKRGTKPQRIACNPPHGHHSGRSDASFRYQAVESVKMLFLLLGHLLRLRQGSLLPGQKTLLEIREYFKVANLNHGLERSASENRELPGVNLSRTKLASMVYPNHFVEHSLALLISEQRRVLLPFWGAAHIPY
mmetsp:Transcript_21933/g.89185  ORF Transcript_21933/g.89185 Transcript_21933/m.89185 type:complete len:194 (-) Transcript_21933:512-1093(-)